jgi:uncharacterized protein YcbX
VRPHVAWIHVAPIKALAIEERERVELGPKGVDGDRRFCIVDEQGRMQNAKRIPMLVAIRPEFDDDRRHLTLHMPDGTRVDGELLLGEPLDITIFGRPLAARAVVGPWSEALSTVAGRPLRLVRAEREGDGVDRADDGGAATLLSAEALRALGSAAGAEAPVDPRRFRMLFGIADVPAHVEDTWIGERVRIGGAVVVPMGNVGRCAVTTVDPLTGRPDLDTLGALARYRGERVTTERLPFGVWARVERPGPVSLGDDVAV